MILTREEAERLNRADEQVEETRINRYTTIVRRTPKPLKPRLTITPSRSGRRGMKLPKQLQPASLTRSHGVSYGGGRAQVCRCECVNGVPTMVCRPM